MRKFMCNECGQEMKENRLRRFGHFKRRNNDIIVKKMFEIIVEENQEDQRKSGQELLGNMRECGVNKEMVRDREEKNSSNYMQDGGEDKEEEHYRGLPV